MNFDNTALLLIDMQNEEGTSEIAEINDIVQNTASILGTCRQKEIPVVYTRHINRADGVGLANKEPVNNIGEPIYYHSNTKNIEIADNIKPNKSDIIIDKYRYSGFYESNLNMMLKSLGVEHLIIGGVLTDVCVLSTALDAYYRDYQINIVEDICGTTTKGAHMAAMMMMANWIYDIEIYNTNQIKNKILGKSYQSWKATAPDQLQFSPDNLRNVYQDLHNHLTYQSNKCGY